MLVAYLSDVHKVPQKCFDYCIEKYFYLIQLSSFLEMKFVALECYKHLKL